MAYSNGKNIRTDKYGRPTMLVKCKPNKNGFPEGYLEIGSQLYKCAVSNNLKDGGYWIQVTKLAKQNRSM